MFIAFISMTFIIFVNAYAMRSQMKRILFIYILMMYVLCVDSQTIAKDETTANGRFITTTFMPAYDDHGHRGNVSLGIAYNQSMQTFFSLNLQLENEGDLAIDKGNTLQLITIDGNIILLRNSQNKSSDSYESTTNAHCVSIAYGVQYNEKELANLDEIMNERIVKIKVETNNGIIEREISDNNFSKSIYSCFQILKKHLEDLRM